jgi:hypothetical protein
VKIVKTKIKKIRIPVILIDPRDDGIVKPQVTLPNGAAGIGLADRLDASSVKVVNTSRRQKPVATGGVRAFR